MLGGQYLGHLPTGASIHTPTFGVLIIQGSTHETLSGILDILQYHTVGIDDTTHETTSGNLSLNEVLQLLINNSLHSITSNNAELAILYALLVNSSTHETSSQAMLKIFNWDEMNKFFGTYIKDFEDVGSLNNVDGPDTSIFVIEHDNKGTYSVSSISSTGTYIKKHNKQGIL